MALLTLSIQYSGWYAYVRTSTCLFNLIRVSSRSNDIYRRCFSVPDYRQAQLQSRCSYLADSSMASRLGRSVWYGVFSNLQGSAVSANTCLTFHSQVAVLYAQYAPPVLPFFHRELDFNTIFTLQRNGSCHQKRDPFVKFMVIMRSLRALTSVCLVVGGCVGVASM